MTTETLEMHRGDKTMLEIVLPGNQESDSLGFGAKPDKDLNTARTFYKVTEGNSNWARAYNATTEETTHLILVDSSNTETLTVDELYWEVIDLGDDDNTIGKGKLWVEGDVITPNDSPPSSTPTTYYPGCSKYYKVKLADDESFDTDNAVSQGFDGTITPSISGNTVTLTSTEDDFDREFMAYSSGAGSVRPKYVSATVYEFELPNNWATYWDVVLMEIFKR